MDQPNAAPVAAAPATPGWKVEDCIAQFWKDERTDEPTEADFDLLGRFGLWLTANFENRGAPGRAAPEPAPRDETFYCANRCGFSTLSPYAAVLHVRQCPLRADAAPPGGQP